MMLVSIILFPLKEHPVAFFCKAGLVVIFISFCLSSKVFISLTSGILDCAFEYMITSSRFYWFLPAETVLNRNEYIVLSVPPKPHRL